MMRYELTEYEWAAIRPMLPNKARGVGYDGTWTRVTEVRAQRAPGLSDRTPRSRDLAVRATRHKGRLNSFVTDCIAGDE